MKIGIDAKWLLHGNPSGKVVIRNVVKELIKVNDSNEIFLFFHSRDESKRTEIIGEIGNCKNVKLVFIPTCVNFLSNMLLMPFYVKNYKLDTCLYQNFAPIILSKRVKNVVFIHDFLFFDYPEYFSFIERKVFRLMRYTTRFVSSIITISNSEKERINRYIKRKKSIHVVYHGISSEFQPIKDECRDLIRQQYKLPNRFLLYLGRINVRKNIKILLDAMPFVDENFDLVIIGKKDHKTFDINKQIIDLNLKNRVHLLGHLEYNDLLRVIASAHLFVFPSFAEGFGLPPLEAMKSGVPTIVSNATCLPEICGDAALFFHPEKKEELLMQINKFNNSDENREIYITRGLNHSKQFTWEKSARQILNILIQQ